MHGSSTPPREVELKLEAEPDALARVGAHPLLEKARQGTRTVALSSTYFDTPDQTLRKAGVSLRVRSEGERHIQTIKAARRPDAVVLDRTEWDAEVPGAGTLDLEATADTALASLLADTGVREALAPLFTVRVERTAALVERGGSLVEVALDDGVVEAGDKTSAFAEVELELRRGEPAELFRLALDLAETVPLRLSLRTKSDRGYDLVRGKRAKAQRSEPIELERGVPVAEAFQTIARSCLKQLLGNEAVLRTVGRDAAAVHQMRVALRRLRAAITLFRDALADERRDAVKLELKWMADQLGAARDLDVYVAKVLEPARDRHAEEPGFHDLVAEYGRRRDEAYARAGETIGSARLWRGVLATAAWVEAGPWLTAKDGSLRRARRRPIEKHAAGELDRRWRRIVKRARHLAVLTPEARHEVRIEIKKLRYATEFFAALHVGEEAEPRRRAALDALETLQETLGDLNDIAVGTAAPAETPAAALLQREQQAKVDGLLAEATAAYAGFADLDRFWKKRFAAAA